MFRASRLPQVGALREAIAVLRDDINNAMKAAMKAGQARRVSTLRMVNAAILQRETSGAERLKLSDAEILDVMGKMIKQRQESLDIYEKAGRAELAAQEREEIDIISAYLPKQMSDREAGEAISSLIKELEAADAQGHGPHHDGAEGAIRRADGFLQGQRDGEEAARRRVTAMPSKRRMLVGLLGANIQGSMSPALFADAFAAAGIDGYYHLLDADRLPARLPQLFEAIKTAGFIGANVTFPFKQEIIAAARCRGPGRRPGRRGEHRRDRARWPLHRLQLRSRRMAQQLR